MTLSGLDFNIMSL